MYYGNFYSILYHKLLNIYDAYRTNDLEIEVSNEHVFALEYLHYT
jgi:hypothetical protein